LSSQSRQILMWSAIYALPPPWPAAPPPPPRPRRLCRAASAGVALDAPPLAEDELASRALNKASSPATPSRSRLTRPQELAALGRGPGWRAALSRFEQLRAASPECLASVHVITTALSVAARHGERAEQPRRELERGRKHEAVRLARRRPAREHAAQRGERGQRRRVRRGAGDAGGAGDTGNAARFASDTATSLASNAYATAAADGPVRSAALTSSAGAANRATAWAATSMRPWADNRRSESAPAMASTWSTVSRRLAAAAAAPSVACAVPSAPTSASAPPSPATPIKSSSAKYS